MKRFQSISTVLFATTLIVGNALSGYAQGYSPQQAPNQVYGAPAGQLLLPAGTWISVRVDNGLSSDQNRSGDSFTATLTQPLVVNGLVAARRGQMVEGRVVEARPAGRASGTSRLSLEIAEVGLVDGQQLPVQTQMIEYQGPTSVGGDAAVIATTTGVGAAIGAAVDGGFGAGMGAIAGAAASTIGVLLTPGRPTVIYPESVITFRTMIPIAIYTGQSYMAFQPVTAADYAQPAALQRRVVAAAPAPPPVVYRSYYGPYAYPYYPYAYPYYAPTAVFPGVVIGTPAFVFRARPSVVVVHPRSVVTVRGGRHWH